MSGIRAQARRGASAILAAMATRSKRGVGTAELTVTLDPDLANRLNELARDGGKSREQLVADAVREYVERADPSLGTDRNVPPPKGG